MSHPNRSESKVSNSLIEILLRQFLPFWPMFFVLILIGIAAAFFYIKVSVPVFEVRAKVLINDQKKGSDDSKLVESLNFIGTKKIVENEIEVIQSVDIATKVVNVLHLYAPITMDGAVFDKSAFSVSPVMLEFAEPGDIRQTKKVEFSFDSVNHAINILNRKILLNDWVDLGFGKMRFIENPYSNKKQFFEKYHFSLIPVHAVAKDLLNNLEVTSSSKMSTVLNLKIKDESQIRGENILNTFIEAYVISSINEKNVIAANTLAFVEERLNYLSKELDSVESKIQNYKTQKGIVNIGEQGKQFLETVGSNDMRVSELSVQLAALDEVEQYVVGNKLNSVISPSTLGIKDPVLNQLLDKLYTSELELESLRKTTAPKNPILLSLNDQIRKIKNSVIENINSQRRNLEAGRANISTFNNKYSSLLKGIPRKEHELLEISRQHAIKSGIYSFLLQKREETVLSNATVVADSKIIENPHSTIMPVKPNRIITYVIGIIIPLLVGGAIVLLKELLNSKILFRSEIEENTTVPIIGEINLDNSGEKFVFSDIDRTYVSEQFRQLRTALGWLGVGNRKKKILFTSSISGDGKSFIAANLSVGLAMTGKKVVLLEMDLRQPELTKKFNISSDKGLSNYFKGEIEACDLPQSTAINPNLFVISSGALSKNPTELIIAGRLGELLQILELSFDYILIDAPPVGPVSDAYVIAPYCDTTLYIVRHGHTPKSYIENLDSVNSMKAFRNVAIIFNGIRARGLGKYGPKYGYGFGDMKSYGDFKKKVIRKMANNAVN